MRREYRQGRLQAFQFFIDGVAARRAKCRARICREHVLDEPMMRIAKVIRWVAKRETAAPRAEHMAALRRRTQGLLAVLFHLELLLFCGKKRHTDRDHAPHLRAQLVRDLDCLDGAAVYPKQVDRTLHS